MLFDRLEEFFERQARQALVSIQTDLGCRRPDVHDKSSRSTDGVESDIVHSLTRHFEHYSKGVVKITRIVSTYFNKARFFERYDQDQFGWLTMTDVFPSIPPEELPSIKENIQLENDEYQALWGMDRKPTFMECKRQEVLNYVWKLGVYHREESEPRGGGNARQMALESAQAASPPGRIILIDCLAYKYFRIQVVEPLLVVRDMKDRRGLISVVAARELPVRGEGKRKKVNREEIETMRRLGSLLQKVGVRPSNELRRMVEEMNRMYKDL